MVGRYNKQTDLERFLFGGESDFPVLKTITRLRNQFAPEVSNMLAQTMPPAP